MEDVGPLVVASGDGPGVLDPVDRALELVAAFADLAVEAGGPAALRDVIAEDGWSSPIWTRADCYQFGAERAALEAYERAVLTEKLTEFRRFTTGTVAPHAAAYPGDEWVKRLIAQLNSIESTIDLVASA